MMRFLVRTFVAYIYLYVLSIERYRAACPSRIDARLGQTERHLLSLACRLRPQLSYVAGRRYFTLVFAVFAYTGLALIWLDDDATCITYSSSSS